MIKKIVIFLLLNTPIFFVFFIGYTMAYWDFHVVLHPTGKPLHCGFVGDLNSFLDCYVSPFPRLLGTNLFKLFVLFPFNLLPLLILVPFISICVIKVALDKES